MNIAARLIFSSSKFHHILSSFTNSSRTYSTGWRLRCGLFSSVQSLSINVFTGLHLHTSSMNCVRWRTLRLVNDFVPPRLHHWLSAVLDCPPSMTGLFRCSCLEQCASTCYLLSLCSCLPVHLNTHLFHLVSHMLLFTVPAQWCSLLWTLQLLMLLYEYLLSTPFPVQFIK